MGIGKYVTLRSIDGIPGEYSETYSEAEKLLEEDAQELEENFEEWDINVFDGVAIYKLVTHKYFKVDMEATKEYLEECKENNEKPKHDCIVMMVEDNYEVNTLDKVPTEDLMEELRRRKMMV